MTNEAVPVEGPYEIHDFVVGAAVPIPQYSLCILSDPRTIAISSGNDVFAGIAATEKSILNNDVSTRLGLATKGVFKLKPVAGHGISAVGEPVALSGVNLIRVAVAGDLLLGKVIGKALEFPAGDEAIDVMVGVI